MKNLKKLVSVVLAVSMLLSVMAFSVSAATFADVADTDSAYEAVEVLAALKILEGKEAGSFDPAGDIKRSEFAAVVCRAMNEEASAKGSVGGTSFADVAADHWAAGYINWAAQRGIVNGRDENTFDPDAPVSYQEAVKMLVVALGFEVMAQKKGGYPTGYMVVGSSYGITKGVSMNPATGNASRADVAKLVYNALDCPLMDTAFISLSDEDEYLVYDGGVKANGERRTLLSYYHNIAKVKAVVDETFKTDETLINNKGEKSVKLDITNYYKFTEVAVEELIDANIAVVEGESLPSIKVLAFDEASDFVGYTVIAYLAQNEDNKVELVALVADSKSVELLEINDFDLISTATVAENGNINFEYYENADTSIKTPLKFVNNADLDIYVNGKVSESASIANLAATGASKAVLLKNENDLVSKVFLTVYNYYLVESVDAAKEIIRAEGKNFRLSEDDNNEIFSYNIYKDGAAIGLEDIAAGDLLNVVTTRAMSGDVLVYDFYVTSNTIEGTVDSVSYADDEGTIEIYEINGVEYLALDPTLDLSAGETGSFIVTIDGKLFDAEITKSFSANYAFILDIGKATSPNTLVEGTWKIELLSKDNTVAIKDVAKKVNFNGVRVEKATLDAKMNTLYDLIYTTAVVNEETEETVTVLIDNSTVIDNLADRMITYKETDGVITDIITTADDIDVADINTGFYRPTADKFDGYTINADSVLFSVPVNVVGEDEAAVYTVDTDAAQVYPFSNLRDDKPYDGYIYDIDTRSDRTFGAALTYTEMEFAGQVAPFAILKAVSSGLDQSGNITNMVTLYQSGEEKKIPVSVEATEGYVASLTAGATVYGDIIHYTTNANGEMDAAMLVYDYSEKALAADLNDLNPDITYEIGLVEDISAKAIGLIKAVGADPDYLTWDLDETSTNVVFDVAKAANSINNAFKAYVEDRDYLEEYDYEFVEADWDDDEETPDSTEKVFKSAAYILVTRLVQDDIVDVVAYKYDAKDEAISAFLADFFPLA